MASTPFGRRDKFFAVNYRAGSPPAIEGHESFHWPSMASPLVDRALLDMWKQTSTDREYRAEVLAEWVADQGAYFSADELDAALEDFDLIPPEKAKGRSAICGVDWGFAQDANTMVLLAEDAALTRKRGTDGPLYVVPYLEENFGLAYSAHIDRVVDAGDTARRGLQRRGYQFKAVVSEQNGVGAYPSQELQTRLIDRGAGVHVTGVNTTSRLREDSFGWLKTMLQQRRLVLPRHPSLLKQLLALEYETLESGTVRIAVPERSGHDDLCMGLMLAASYLKDGGTGPERYFASIAWICLNGQHPNHNARSTCEACATPRVVPAEEAAADGADWQCSNCLAIGVHTINPGTKARCRCGVWRPGYTGDSEEGLLNADEYVSPVRRRAFPHPRNPRSWWPG